MKTIEAISIWDKGEILEAKILTAYAINVSLGNSATFYYQLSSQTDEGNMGMQLAQGNLTMSGEDYAQWDVDTFAWDWIANKLNLVVTGDFVAPAIPVPAPGPAPVIEEEVVTEE